MFSLLYTFFLHFYLINIHIFDYPDSRLSGLFTEVPTSPDNRGLTVTGNCSTNYHHLITRSENNPWIFLSTAINTEANPSPADLELHVTGNCSTNYHHLITRVPAIKRLSLYASALWGQDLEVIFKENI